MKKIMGLIAIAGGALLMGCTAKNVQDVGGGLQIGSTAGGPLSGYVAGVGIAADVAGNIMGVDRSPQPGTPEFEKAKEGLRLTACRSEVVRRFKKLAQITADTTAEQLQIAAQTSCSEYDQLVEAKGFVKMKKRNPSPKLLALADGEESDYYLFRALSKPYGEKCVEEMVVIGNRFVEKAKKEGGQTK